MDKKKIIGLSAAVGVWLLFDSVKSSNNQGFPVGSPAVANTVHSVVYPMIVRNDAAGGGNFHDCRGGGCSRLHNGTDFVVSQHQAVFAPIDGIVTRSFDAYSGTQWKGMEIQGIGVWSAYKIKIMYIYPDYALVNTTVLAGDKIGTAQNISARYNSSSMLDHVHVEVYENGIAIDPLILFNNMYYEYEY